jgi:hypothetical protein
MNPYRSIQEAVTILQSAGLRPYVATLYPSRDVAIIVEGIPKVDETGYNKQDSPTSEVKENRDE